MGRVQGLGIVVWAFAKLGCDAACPAVMRLLGEFAAEALRRLEHPGGDPTMQLGAQSLSNLVRPTLTLEPEALLWVCSSGLRARLSLAWAVIQRAN